MSLVRLIIYLFFSIIFTSCDDEENILVQDAVKLLDQEDVLFLDVRTSQEFKYEGSIKNALLIPVNDLEKKITMLEAYKSKNVLNGKVLYSDNNRIDTNNILKFY